MCWRKPFEDLRSNVSFRESVVLDTSLRLISNLFSQETAGCTCLKKNLNASNRPSEHPPVRGGGMSKRLGGIIGCKDMFSRHARLPRGFRDRRQSLIPHSLARD